MAATIKIFTLDNLYPLMNILETKNLIFTKDAKTLVETGKIYVHVPSCVMNAFGTLSKQFAQLKQDSDCQENTKKLSKKIRLIKEKMPLFEIKKGGSPLRTRIHPSTIFQQLHASLDTLITILNEYEPDGENVSPTLSEESLTSTS